MQSRCRVAFEDLSDLNQYLLKCEGERANAGGEDNGI